MHSKDLRAEGESEQRLYLLDAWREAPGYTEREWAALAWAEAVTLVADSHVPDAVYDEAKSVNVGLKPWRGAVEKCGARDERRLYCNSGVSGKKELLLP